jgi:hypothetical protein
VVRKPCSTNGFVPADRDRDDVPTAALAKERDCLFSFAPVETFGHREDVCVRRSGLRGVWAALGVSGVHFRISADTTTLPSCQSRALGWSGSLSTGPDNGSGDRGSGAYSVSLYSEGEA